MANENEAAEDSEELTAEWRRWALNALVPLDRLDEAVAAAIALGRAGADATTCAAGGLVAAGLGNTDSRSRLAGQAGIALNIATEIERVAPLLQVELAARGRLVGHFSRRAAALKAAAAATPRPLAPAPASAPVIASEPTPPSPAPPAPAPRRPMGTSLRQFVGENSILLLSYTGAFLLFVATVLFELYGVEGTNRFGAVLALDVVFAAAGWACLRSSRLRLVGHTYVAIFALLTPLVFAAAYVFLGLGRQGITVDQALLVTGAGCALLYAALAIRMRAEGYGVLALLALPVAAYGATSVAGLGPWRGPALALLVSVYSLVAYPGRRAPAAFRIFSRFAPWFVHLAALGAGVITFMDATHFHEFPSWLLAPALAIIGAGYVGCRLLGGVAACGYAGLAALLLACALGLDAAGAGSWEGPALVLFAVPCAAIWLGTERFGSAGARFLEPARVHVHLAVGLALLVTLLPMGNSQHWQPWRLEATLGLAAAVYSVAYALRRRPALAQVALVGFGLAWAALAHDAGVGRWAPVLAVAPALAHALTGLGPIRNSRFGVDTRAWTHLHVLGFATLALGYLLASSSSLDRFMDWPGAVTFGGIALAAGLHAALTDEPIAAFAARAAFGVAFTLTVRDLGLGAWRGPADTILVALYALSGLRRLRAGRVGALMSAHRQWLVHGSAAVAVALTVIDQPQPPPSLDWHLAALSAGLGGAYLIFTFLGGRNLGAALALAATGLAWATAGNLLGLGPWQAVALVPYAAILVVVAARASRLGEGGAALAKVAEPAVHAAVVAALVIGVRLTVGADRPEWPPAALFLALAATYGLHWVLLRQHLVLLAVATALSLTVLAGGGVLDTGMNGVAVELVLLAAAWAVGAEFAPDPSLRGLLFAGMAIQSLLPIAAVAHSPAVEAAVLTAGTVLFAAQAARHRHPAWLLPAGATAASAWFWTAAAALGSGYVLGEGMPAVMAPFALSLGVIALGLRAALGRRWAVPLYLEAAITMLFVAAAAITNGQTGLAGGWLLADAAVVYAAAGVERRPEGAVAAAATAFAGAVALLHSMAAAVIWYPVALGALSVAIYAAQLPWERYRGRTSDWLLVHRYLGLGGAGLTALAGFLLQDQAKPGSVGCVLAGVAVLIFAGLVRVDAARHRTPAVEYGALFTAALASYFAVRYFAISEPQWYTAAPALVLIGIGLRLPHDSRLTLPAHTAQVLTAVGATLLLGLTAVQSLNDPGWAHAALLLAEGAAALVAGIGLRSRVLVVAGGAAIGAAALRALFTLIQQHLLFLAFGAVAILLLALGAAMALLRDQVQEARTGFTETWREWN